MYKFILDSGWLLKEQPLNCTKSMLGKVAGSEEGWIQATVPGDVHVDLINAGKIEEPIVGLNCYKSEWIEDRSWWYKKTFKTEKAFKDGDIVEITLNSLDSMADIFLNGNHLGFHKSSFRPFVMDIKEYLKEENEENTLIVRLTTGAEYFSKNDISYIESYVNIDSVEGRGDRRRAFIRKPQDLFGVDFSPRIVPCGITGEVKINAYKKGKIDYIYIVSEIEKDNANLNIELNFNYFDKFGTSEGRINFIITDSEGNQFVVNKDIFIRSGNNYYKFNLVVKDPKLWWPNGYGEQELYEVNAAIIFEGTKVEYPEFAYGIRTVELDLQKINEKERLFAFIVNGKRIYCRGGNWVPPDSVYARVSDEKYEQLIKEAKNANFNMLRNCGGGIYEKDVFYKSCDKHGIMVWQDFMLCCSAYPDDQEWFVDEIIKEAKYQLVRLRNYASIVMWSGSNENHMGYFDWWEQGTDKGFYLYNNVLSEMMYKYANNVPYWNGCPYGGKYPNSNEIGDRHHWLEIGMNKDIKERMNPYLYDKLSIKFVTEFGHFGPCVKESTTKYLGESIIDIGNDNWIHHKGSVEKGEVIEGIISHYVDKNKITEDSYFLYGGLVQGMMYEYALDSFRSDLNCSGALFWMYNDCWGELGWSIIDYYLRRKISYYFVKRANTPVRLIIRKRDNDFLLVVANERPKSLKDIVEVGYQTFKGETKSDKFNIDISPFGRREYSILRGREYNLTEGIIYSRLIEEKNGNTAIMRNMSFRKLTIDKPDIEIVSFKSNDNSSCLIIKSSKYAHAVSFNLPEEYILSDEYFDLIGGEEKEIIIKGKGLTKDKIKISSVLV